VLSVNTNLSSLFSQRKIRENQDDLSRSMEKLSSGLRINSAKDDSAGLTISSEMTASIRSAQSLNRNIGDGISLVQVAEGALTEVDQILQRARELAVQASNGTLNSSDRKVLNQEFLQLKSEVDRLADSTEIFGIHPLKGDPIPPPVVPPVPKPPDLPVAGDTKHIMDVFFHSGYSTDLINSGIIPIAYIPSGAINVQINMDDNGADDDIQIFTQNGKHLAGTPASDSAWIANSVNSDTDFKEKVFLESSGFKSDAQYDDSQLLNGQNAFGLTEPLPLNLNYNGMNISYSGDGYPNSNERIIIDKTTEPLLIIVVGSQWFKATAFWDTMPPKGAIPPVEPTPPEPVEPVVVPPEPPKPINIVVEAQYGQSTSVIGINKTPSTTKDLDLEEVVIDPFAEAQKAMTKLSAALEKVSDYRSYYGATQQRLEFSLISRLVPIET
jgi:flagellin